MLILMTGGGGDGDSSKRTRSFWGTRWLVVGSRCQASPRDIAFEIRIIIVL